MGIKLSLKRKNIEPVNTNPKPLAQNTNNNENFETFEFANGGEIVDDEQTFYEDANENDMSLRPTKKKKMDKIKRQVSNEVFKKRLIPNFDTLIAESGAHLKWNQIGLPLQLTTYLENKFPKITEIQRLAIPNILNGSDFLGVAPTGSGKTLGFSVPIIKHVLVNKRAVSVNKPSALVLVPTRELCTQVYEVIKELSDLVGLASLACYGGVNIANDIKYLLKFRPDIIVATPGRLIDLLASNSSGALDIGHVTLLAIDEIDRMFDMGFEPQVRRILHLMRDDRQTVLFSATLSQRMETSVLNILNPEELVEVNTGIAKIPASVTQKVLYVKAKGKFDRLLADLKQFGSEQALVFVETQKRADDLCLKLTGNGIACQSLHGGMDQRDRNAALEDFIAKTIRVVVATSIAARGIDVSGLKLVVNYDPASHIEDYIHRAGRTGRAGTSGTCITYITDGETRQAYELQKFVDLEPKLEQMAQEFDRERAKENKNNEGDEPVDKKYNFGFGGHGLSRMERKWRDQKQTETEFSQETGQMNCKIINDNDVFATILDLNDVPQNARVSLTSGDIQNKVFDNYNVQVTTRGTFITKKTDKNTPGLHLYLEGEAESDVIAAYQHLQRLLVTQIEKASGGRDQNYDTI